MPDSASYTQALPSEPQYGFATRWGFFFAWLWKLQKFVRAYLQDPSNVHITGASDDYDLPQEWGAYLKFKLAVDIAPEYEVPDKKFKQLVALAEQYFTLLDGWDQEAASVYLQPNNWMYNSQWQRRK